MGGLVDYDYDFFDEYQSDVLADLPSIEQLIRLDDEVANKVTMPRYEGPVDPIEWTFLENYYSGLFADFITDRIQGLVDTEPIEANRDRFHGFREDIVSVNQNLPAQRAARSGVISKPAETVLLKRLRQLGFDPSALDVSHIGSGGWRSLPVGAVRDRRPARSSVRYSPVDSPPGRSRFAGQHEQRGGDVPPASACPDGLPVG